MSEVREFVDEIKDRLAAWRLRGRVGQDVDAYDSTDSSTDVPEVEFTPLNPFAPSRPAPPRAFADLTPAWIAAQCAPHIFAQGQQLLTRKQVMRAVAHNGRLAGTTCERHYEDQEILLQDGSLSASCTCRKRNSAPAAAAPSVPAVHNSPTQASARTLACPHVVAVLLAYVQSPAPVLANPAPERAAASKSGKLVCPVTRQTLNPKHALFQCTQCGLYYSPEGWDFLRKEARGICCNCKARNTVKEVAGG